MASFRFGRDPFRFESSVFQPESRPEVWAPQQYEPTPLEKFKLATQPPPVEEPSQPAGTEKKLFDTQSEQVNEYPMMDKFSELLSQRPQREDYKPSVWRNILAGVAGGTQGMLDKSPNAGQAAFDATTRIRDAPYDRATRDWTGQIAGYGEGAKMELQKADKENKFLTMLNNARRTDLQGQRWEGQTTNEAAKIDVAKQALAQRMLEGASKGWKYVKANGRVLEVKPGEEPRDIGEDVSATVARQNAATGAQSAADRRALGWANVGLGKERNAIAATNANTGISRAEIALMDAETRQDNSAISYYRAQVAGEQFNRQLENDIFRQALQQAEFDRGDKSPEARNMSPTQRMAAYNLSLAKVINDNPELVNVIDPETNRIDPDADPDLLDQFTFKLRQEMGNQLLYPRQDQPIESKPVKPFPKSTPRKVGPAPAPRSGGLVFPSPGSVVSPVTPESQPGTTPPLTFKRYEDLKK